MDNPFRCETALEAGGSICVVLLSGKIDALAAEELQTALRELLTQGHSRYVFDLAALDYIGSLGLGVLVAFRNDPRVNGGVVFCNTTPFVRSTLQVTKLDKHFRMYPSRADAIDAIRTR